jgi:hypothetical protein
MARIAPDLIGHKFTRLLVVERGARHKGILHWRCKCDCGNEKEVKANRLQKGTTKSCGCLATEVRSRLGKALGHSVIPNRGHVKVGTAFRAIFSNYKCAAKKRSLVWELSEDQFRALVTSPCHYTGTPPSNTSRARSGEVFLYSGIDRIDSNKGYTIDNCVPCCGFANRAKSDMKYNDFITMCSIITERTKCNQP